MNSWILCLFFFDFARSGFERLAKESITFLQVPKLFYETSLKPSIKDVMSFPLISKFYTNLRTLLSQTTTEEESSVQNRLRLYNAVNFTELKQDGLKGERKAIGF